MGYDREHELTFGRRATRISKKGGTPFHPGSVNSSFRYSSLSSRSPFSSSSSHFGASYFMRNGTMPKAGPKSFVERGSSKRKDQIYSRVQHFFRVMREEDGVLYGKEFGTCFSPAIDNTVPKVNCNGNKLMHF